MGTRNLTMVIDKMGDIKVAQYGQWDGYPEGQGATILAFCKNKEKMNLLEEALKRCAFYEEMKTWSDFDRWLEANAIITDTDKYWFENLKSRDIGGEILDNIINIDREKLPSEHHGQIVLCDDTTFGKDSLFCEWAYCVNFQTNKLECFMGFNQNFEAQHPRFHVTKEEVEGKGHAYYGCRLIKEYDLDNLPEEKDFVAELTKFDKGDDEDDWS